MLTQKRLKELLDYDPDTGFFTWLVSTSNRSKVGQEAGSITSENYMSIMVCGKKYQAHRLAFLYMEGFFPEHNVDHKNGVRRDNVWSNLRHVTRSCNMQNQKFRSNNTSGFPGTSKHKHSGQVVAEITINQKSYYLGIYKDPLEAALARLTMEVWHKDWTCNHRSELVNSIKRVWKEFNDKCLS